MTYFLIVCAHTWMMFNTEADQFEAFMHGHEQYIAENACAMDQGGEDVLAAIKTDPARKMILTMPLDGVKVEEPTPSTSPTPTPVPTKAPNRSPDAAEEDQLVESHCTYTIQLVSPHKYKLISECT